MTTAVCPHCEVEKDYDEDFYKRKAPTSGNIVRSGWCKTCMTEYGKARQKAAHEALRILEREGRA